MDYSQLNERLVETLPWITDEPEYRAGVADWSHEIPGPHVVYGDVLVPIIVRLLADNPDDERLRGAFRFVEELVADDGEGVSEVGVVTVLEGLHGFPEVRATAYALLGTRSREYANKLAADWGG